MITESETLSRRAFLGHSLVLAAGATAAGLWLELRSATARADGVPAAGGLEPNVFVHVAPDGEVTITCHRSEMGQGIRSSLPVLLAAELGANLERVRIRQADGDPAYGDQDTDGSNSIRTRLDELRRLAASARLMLVAAAARGWGVDPATCGARDHQVIHHPSGRKLEYGALAAAASREAVPQLASIALRPLSELEPVGGPRMPFVDAQAYVTGTAQFGADVRLPGMCVAVIARPPSVGGRIANLDTAAALAVPGVRQVIRMPEPVAPYGYQPWGGVAVVADDTWSAMRGRAALELSWEPAPGPAYDSEHFRAELSAAAHAPGLVARNTGDVEAALAGAHRTIEAEYHVPHLPHVSMEPPVALARVSGDRCEIWAATQNPQAARKEAARVLGWPESRVTVHTTFLGGGFGRKSKADFAGEAAYLARAAGLPVRVQWTREDDLRHDYYNTVSTQLLTAGIDARGKVVAWRHRTAFPPISSLFTGAVQAAGADLQQGVLDLPLAVPNVRAEACAAKAHVRIGWLRSVYNIFHAFAINSFMDELAHELGRDPREVMLELLGPPRHASLAELGIPALPNYHASLADHPVDVGRLRHVIERVTEASGWSRRRAHKRSFGLAAHRSFLSYAAAVVSAYRDPQGRIGIDEAWIVIDAGQVLHPDRVRAQMEGSVVFGTSIALHGGVTMKGGATEQGNFDTMKIARMRQAARKIHVELVESRELPGGVGEPGVPPVAPAIANAVFALTGQRVRRLPLEAAGIPLVL